MKFPRLVKGNFSLLKLLPGISRKDFRSSPVNINKLPEIMLFTREMIVFSVFKIVNGDYAFNRNYFLQYRFFVVHINHQYHFTIICPKMQTLCPKMQIGMSPCFRSGSGIQVLTKFFKKFCPQNPFFSVILLEIAKIRKITGEKLRL